MASIARNRGVGASALSAAHFLLLYAAMLVAAAGNTALQSVMPAIGREIGIGDFYVAIAYTWSAVLWVLLAPYWAEKSDHHGRKALTIMGVSGFVVSMTLCGLALFGGLHRWIGGALTFSLFAVFRAIYGGDVTALRGAKKQDLQALTASIKAKANERFGSELVEDVLIGKFNFVPKNEVRNGANLVKSRPEFAR